MSKFHILGSGACGFLRLHFLLKDEIAIKYKGGGRNIKTVLKSGMMMD